MTESPEGVPPAKDWRLPAVTGLAIGVGIATARGVERNLETRLGPVWAVVASLLAAAVVGGLSSLVLSWLIKPGGKGRA